MAYQPFISYAPLFIAMENGYFKEHGIDLEITFLDGPKAMLPASRGDLDVIGGSIGVGFFNSVAQGLDFKVVADKGQIRYGYGYVPIVIRKALWDNGTVRLYRDLAKIRISSNSPGSFGMYHYAMALEEAGVPYEHEKLKYLDPPKCVNALTTGAIDACWMPEPWATRAERLGVGRIFVTTDQLNAMKGYQVAVVIYSGKFIRERRNLAQEWMKAYIRGVRFYHEKGPVSDAVVSIVNKYTKVEPEVIRAAIPVYFVPDGSVNLDSVKRFQEWCFQRGFVKEKVDLDKVVDLSFIRAAMQQ